MSIIITGGSQTEYLKHTGKRPANNENLFDGKSEVRFVFRKNGKRSYLIDKFLVDKAIDNLKKASDIFSRRLSYQVDKETNRIIVKVIDTETDKVIKEIPPEQIVELAAKIREMIGLLVDEER